MKTFFRIKQVSAPNYYVAPQTERQRVRYGGYRLTYKKSAGWKATKRQTAQNLLDQIIAYYKEVQRLEPDRKFTKTPEEMFVIEESLE